MRLRRQAPQLPPLIHRYVERRGGERQIVKLAPGGIYVSREDEDVVTVLGSCISVCAHDPVARVGGMNHFMLPGDETIEEPRLGTANHWERQRFGCFAMESLINGVLQAGGKKGRLELKVFGGAAMLTNPTSSAGRVGIMNVRFFWHYIDRESLRVVAEDTGGNLARRLKYHPRSGQAFLWREFSADVTALVEQERIYRENLRSSQTAGKWSFFEMPFDSSVAGRDRAIRVVVVDDSALVRRMLKQILGSDPAIEVVGAAQDPFVARDMIKQLNPDVLTLDVEMPRMTGLAFLENLMRLRPMPVVMVSSLTQKGAETTLEALSLGAVDFVAKPQIDLTVGLEQVAHEIIRKVKAAAGARCKPLRAAPPARSIEALARSARTGTNTFATTDKLIAIGASTGGTEAIREVLEDISSDSPGVVIAQHIPAAFSAPFAARLDKSTGLNVCEAKDGERILPGHAYVAPGGRHLLVEGSGARWHCRLSDAPPVNQHRPSVDCLFESVARAAGANAVAALLTGMGDDGARGLKLLRDAGAATMAQDEATSVVWGMPGSAVRLGAAEQVLPLGRIAEALLRAARSRSITGPLEGLAATTDKVPR